MLIFPSQRNYSLPSGFSVERLRQVLLLGVQLNLSVRAQTYYMAGPCRKEGAGCSAFVLYMNGAQ